MNKRPIVFFKRNPYLLPVVVLLSNILLNSFLQLKAQVKQTVSNTIQLPTNNSKASKVLLPNGWSLTPVGRSIPLGDLPLNMVLSHNQQMLAVTNNGHSTQTVQLINPKTEKLLDQVIIEKSWYGLKFSDDDKTLYASGGNDNIIVAYAINNKKIGKADTLFLGKPWPNKISPAGIDVDSKKSRLYTVTKEDSSLYIVNLKSKAVVNKLFLGAEAYSCLLNADKSLLYISLWGGDKVIVVDAVTLTIKDQIVTQSHPNEMILTKDGKFLFVANANDNSVSVIDTKSAKVIETIAATLFPTTLSGSTTNGLALSSDEKTLYIANADNNCLAVFNVSAPGNSTSKGFIPTGWYPTNVKTIGTKIMVSNGKGFASMANPHGPQPISKTDNSGYQSGITKTEVQYIGGLFKGTLSFIDEPGLTQLNTYSKLVYENTPFKPAQLQQAAGEEGNPIPLKIGQPSPIKHVFYVIKENRTYDQVLGDMKEGNGDNSLCLFPEKVTPNLHAIAREYVLLDNFYVDAEVSADGHNWSMAGYATDYVEKVWPTSYSRRGGTYDYEGTRKVAFPKDGFIWDHCKRAGISYRTYGEFGSFGKANIKVLEGHVCPGYPDFNLNIKDVDRMVAFRHDFDSLLAIGQVPQFNTIRLGNDHTSGQTKGKITPTSAVADNDRAVGELIQHISESNIWKESAIFILEDDAQNGPDHVDAHRSPAYVISPYIKRGTVNHNMYSTSGILRTMELILGIPPMSQYDAAAVPLFNLFTSTPDLSAFKAKEPGVSLNEINTAINSSSKTSAKFNLTKEDSAPDKELNEVIWKSVKGEQSVMPAPKRSAFVKLEKKRKDVDDK